MTWKYYTDRFGQTFLNSSRYGLSAFLLIWGESECLTRLTRGTANTGVMSPCISLAEHQTHVSLGVRRIRNGKLAGAGMCFCRCFKCQLILNFSCLVCKPGGPSKCDTKQEELWWCKTKKKYVLLCFVFSPGFIAARDLLLNQLWKAAVVCLPFASSDAWLGYWGTA